MDNRTGEIVKLNSEEYERLNAEAKARMIPILRDLAAAEEAQKQINLYSPCGCGSGKKFKFCCHKP